MSQKEILCTLFTLQKYQQTFTSIEHDSLVKVLEALHQRVKIAIMCDEEAFSCRYFMPHLV